MRCLCLVLLLALNAHAEDAEELAALLLSPHEAYRKRGCALLERGRTHERVAALDVVARWAPRSGAFADDVARRLAAAEGAAKTRLQRLARILEDPNAPDIGVDLYLVSLPHAHAARIVGTPALTAASSDPAHWAAWWRTVQEAGGDLVGRLSVPAVAGRTSRPSVDHQVAYIEDFDVEVANGTVIADPVIGVVRLQRKLALRPSLSRDRRFVTIDLDLELQAIERPIRAEDKKLPMGTGRIQKPEVFEHAARQTVTLPLGGYAAWMLRRGKAHTMVAILHAVRGAPTRIEPDLEPR